MEIEGSAPAPSDWLLFGLGNPGTQYERTRHNLGWMLVDLLCERLGVRLSPGRADYVAARGELGGKRIHLIKPTTWMNRSGRAVRQYLAIERPENPGLLVAVDDVALPLGRLRIRPRGSDGGHNGLASVQQHVGGPEYGRLRMGCGPGPEGEDLADYVLEEFAADEWDAVRAMLERAADAVESWIVHGPQPTMSRYNG